MKQIKTLFYFVLGFIFFSCANTKSFTVHTANKVVGNHLLVGASESDITPPPGYPMGGYGSGGRIARGSWLELKARVTYIQDSNGQRVAIINADLWSVPFGMTLRITELLHQLGKPYDLGIEQILLTATHTHNSQAGFHTSEAYNALASPIAGFDPEMFNWLSQEITKTIVAAIDNKTRAVGAISKADISGLIRNRSIHSFRAIAPEAKAEIKSKVPFPEKYFPQSGLPSFVTSAEEFSAVDPVVTSIIFRPEENTSPTPIAILNFLSLHPTIMGQLTEVYSPDIFGVIEQTIKKRTGFRSTVYSFINGSEGDISANWRANDIKNTIDIGTQIADRIMAKFRNSEPLTDKQSALTIAYDIVNISDAGVNIPLRGTIPPCLRKISAKTAKYPFPGVATVGGAEDGRSELYHKGLREGILSSECREGHGQKASAIPSAVDEMFAPLPALLRGIIKSSFYDMICKTAPKYLPLGIYRLGKIVIATIPGEPTTAVGYYVKKAIASELALPDRDQVLIAGLTNEYLSYFTTPAEYATQHYEGASTMYGVHAGSFLEQELARLANAKNHRAKDLSKIKTKPGKEINIQQQTLDSLWKIEEGLANFMIDLKSGKPLNFFPVFQFVTELNHDIPYPSIELLSRISSSDSWELSASNKDDLHFVKVAAHIGIKETTWQILYFGALEEEKEYRFTAHYNQKAYLSSAFHSKDIVPIFIVEEKIKE